MRHVWLFVALGVAVGAACSASKDSTLNDDDDDTTTGQGGLGGGFHFGGNGGSGKTQLSRFLCDLPFETEWNSTHGIRVVHAALPHATGGSAIKLHIWDFGGQDIYHGTHALFVRTRAVFAIVWAANTEPPPETTVKCSQGAEMKPISYPLVP